MTLLEMARVMMSYVSLPTSFGKYALDTAMQLLNLVLSKLVPLTLVELWLRQKSTMRYLHIWGCLTQVLKEKFDKVETKGRGMFVYWVSKRN